VIKAHIVIIDLTQTNSKLTASTKCSNGRTSQKTTWWNLFYRV